MKRTLVLISAVGLAAVPAAMSAPASAAPSDATVSVLHAVPGLTVDVYANGEELIPDFEPGTLTDPLTLPAGTYDLQVFADGDDPDNADPAIEAKGVEVPAGANATVVAHLDAEGNPVLTPYVNDVSASDPGQARLIVRHAAAAPPVDVRADGEVLFADLANPDEASGDVPASTYSADVTLAGKNAGRSRPRRPRARRGHRHHRLRVGFRRGRQPRSRGADDRRAPLGPGRCAGRRDRSRGRR